jgi:light-regulated signal transduction histidine kinase (bacteriophytochrome)
MTIFQLGNEPAFGTVLTQTATAMSAHLQAVASLDEAVAAAGGRNGPKWIALHEPSPETLATARGALDAALLPRWAVVVFHNHSEANFVVENGIWRLSREEWTVPIVTRTFTAAHALHRTERELVQARGDLLSFGHRVAHDLRTPLGGMFTTTEMLREILAEESPANAPLTQPILESGDGMVRLIERTSFFAKVAGSSEAPLRLNMGTLFWNAFQKLEPQIIHAGATLAYVNDWPAVNARASWIEAVWQQLITNALQHGGPGVRMDAGWTRDPQGNRFWLWSSGAVAPERQARLFFPFNRLHESRAPRGFGLPLVRRIVEREDGFCGFEAPETGGARFSFTLPATA